MKILCSADIHISDYSRYNIGDHKFRLNQFITLAHRLGTIYKEENCEKIIISGDSIQTAVIPPETQHVLVNFYTILSDAVKENGGEIIVQLGNHDKNSRSLETHREESIVTLLDMIPNVRYVHKKVEIIDGLKVGFQDFLPEHPLDWYDGKIDILFNHFTDIGEGWGGQEIDKSRFGVMFFGDIHVPYVKGNIVSIGNPIPHRLKDSCEGLCLIINTTEIKYNEDLSCLTKNKLDEINIIKVNNERSISFKWTEIINKENPFLRFYRPDNKPRKCAGEWKYDVEVEYNKVQLTENEELGIDVNLDNLDIDVILKSTLDETTQKIHEQVLAISKGLDISEEAISMNFKMISSHFKNYRSVDDLKIVWCGEVIRFSGSPGAGKSTIANAIMFNFFGNRNVSKQFRDTADIKNDVLTVDQILEYNGLFFRIDRGYKNGKGYLKYWKSSDEDKILLDSYLSEKDPDYLPNQQANKIADIDAMIRRDLPFLDMYHLFYISQSSNGLFTDMKKNERIEMISKLLGWNKIVDFSEIALGLYKDKKDEISLINTEISKLDGAIETIDSMKLVKDNTNYQQQLDTITNSRNQIKSKFDEQKIYDGKLNEINIGISVAQSKLDTVKPTLQNGKVLSEIDCTNKINILNNDIIKLNELAENDKIRYDNEVSAYNINKQKIQSKKEEIILKIGNANLINSNIDNEYQNILNSLETWKQANIKNENLLNIAVENSEKTTEEICENCGQTIHDLEKLELAKKNKLVIVSNFQNLYETSQQRVKEETLRLETCQLKVQNDKVDVEKLKDTIIKIDSMLNTTQSNIDNVMCVDYKLSEKQLLINELNPLSIFMIELSTFNDTINSGIILKSECDIKLQDLNETIHYSLVDMQGFQSIDEKLITEYSEVYANRVTADSNNLALEDNDKRKYQREDKKLSIVSVQDDMEEITKYINLTSFTGPIVQKILEKTSNILSTQTMIVKTIKEQNNGNHKPDLTLSVLIGEKWKDYDQLSGGQLFYADIKFILALFDLIGGCGLCIFDESFRYLNSDMIDEIGAEIKEANIRDTMIITHASSYIHIDKVMNVELNERGISSYSCI